MVKATQSKSNHSLHRRRHPHHPYAIKPVKHGISKHSHHHTKKGHKDHGPDTKGHTNTGHAPDAKDPSGSHAANAKKRQSAISTVTVRRHSAPRLSLSPSISVSETDVSGPGSKPKPKPHLTLGFIGRLRGRIRNIFKRHKETVTFRKRQHEIDEEKVNAFRRATREHIHCKIA